MTEPRNRSPNAERFAKLRRRLMFWMVVYLVVLVATGTAVWAITGSAAVGAVISLVLLVVLPWVSTALRRSYQKRHGLPVRGPWGN